MILAESWYVCVSKQSDAEFLEYKGVSERVSSGRDKFSKIPHIMNIQSATSFKLLFTSIPSHRQMNAYFCKRRERNCDFCCWSWKIIIIKDSKQNVFRKKELFEKGWLRTTKTEKLPGKKMKMKNHVDFGSRRFDITQKSLASNFIYIEKMLNIQSFIINSANLFSLAMRPELEKSQILKLFLFE